MARRQSRYAAPAPRRGHKVLLPLIAAIGIGSIIIGLIAVLLPTVSTGSNDSSAPITQSDLTPGAEEANLRARLSKNPDDVNAMIPLADLLANSGRIDEAVPYYEGAVKARPDDPSLRIAFGTALLHANYTADAETQLLKARDLSPNDPQPLYLLGQLYEAWQPPRTDDARQMYQAAVNVAPGSVYAQRAQDRLNALGNP